MERITSQRKIILDYLKSVTSHPAAEKVYLEVREKLPRISRGTVYRNLNSLKERGEIQEIPANTSRYDGNTSSHAHFICQRCNKIYDIFDVCERCSFLKNNKNNKSKKIKVGKINYYQMYFYGYCKKCSDGKI